MIEQIPQLDSETGARARPAWIGGMTKMKYWSLNPLDSGVCEASIPTQNTLMRLGTFATFGGRYIDTVFAVGCENAMKPGQVHPGLGHQRRQLGDDKLAG
jgi:hypothetical protein